VKEKIMPWIGRKKIAFVPLFRTTAIPPDVVPVDWNSDILRRVLFDPDTTTGLDRSLRAYIHAASSGRADLDAVVMPMATTDIRDVRLEFSTTCSTAPGFERRASMQPQPSCSAGQEPAPLKGEGSGHVS